MVGVASHQRRQIEGDAQARAAGRQQPTISLVGLLRRPEPGKLPHRPELPAIAGRVDAARIRKFPGVAQIARVVERRDALRGVEDVAGHE